MCQKSALDNTIEMQAAYQCWRRTGTAFNEDATFKWMGVSLMAVVFWDRWTMCRIEKFGRRSRYKRELHTNKPGMA